MSHLVRLVFHALITLAFVCSHAQSRLIPYQKKDRWGYADSSGKLVIPARFKAARAFEGKVAVVCDSSGLWAFINHKGNYVVKPQFYQITEKTDGVYYLSDSLHSWADSNGVVSPLRFDKMSTFRYGCAVVNIKNKYGVIRKNGQWLFRPQYQHIDQCGDGFRLMEPGDSVFKYYDQNGKHFLTTPYQTGFSGQSARFVDHSSGRINFFDRSGHRLIPQGFIYFDGDPEDHGVIVQEVSTGLYGVIGNNGEFTLPPVSKMIRLYKPLFVFERDSVYDVLIPHTGRIIREGLSNLSDYYCPWPHKEFIIQLTKGHLHNLTDSTGALYFDRYYASFDRNSAGTWTQANDTFTWKNKKGEVLLRMQRPPYSTALAFDTNGYAVVKKYANNKWTSGLIDLEGNEQLPCRFERIVFDERMKKYLACDDTSTTMMDLDGKSSLWMNAVTRRMPAGYFLLSRPLGKPISLGNITLTGNAGIADSTGKIIAEPVYGLADQLGNRHFIVGQAHLEYEPAEVRSCSFPATEFNRRSKVAHTNMQIIDGKGQVIANITDYCITRDGFFYFRSSGRYMRQDGLLFYEE